MTPCDNGEGEWWVQKKRVNDQALTREKSKMVGETGFEPATCCSQSSRASQAALFPDAVLKNGEAKRDAIAIIAHSVRNLP